MEPTVGSRELADGSSELAVGSRELAGGSGKLEVGSRELGAGSLNLGADIGWQGTGFRGQVSSSKHMEAFLCGLQVSSMELKFGSKDSKNSKRLGAFSREEVAVGMIETMALINHQNKLLNTN